MGIKAGMDMLRSEFNKKDFQVYFAHNFNQNYLSALLNAIGKSPFGIIIISKSGTTLEPAIALDIFFKRLVKNVGKARANKLIAAITDKEKGNLLQTVKKHD
ncbi:MAG: hypothetical protein MJ201_04230 [Mycoplasmoidaceae bacterium]|nr:hypothetical protein [Mycoplasmoidaceae bacterium]